MVVIWEDDAKRELQSLRDYFIKVAGYQTAKHMIDRIQQTTRLLATMPQMGRMEPLLGGLLQGYRSIVAHPNYKVFYRIDDQTVYIVTLFDCRQSSVGLFKRLFGGRDSK